FEQVPDFDAGIADGVLIVDLQNIDLTQPRRRRVTAHVLEFLLPLLLLGRLGIATAVGLVERVLALLFRGNLVTPDADVLGQIGRFRGGLGAFARRMILV